MSNLDGVHYIAMTGETVGSFSELVIEGVLEVSEIDADILKVNNEVQSDMLATDCSYDLGSLTKRWKDLYLCGDASIGGS